MKVQAAAESFVAAEANEHAEAKAAAVQSPDSLRPTGWIRGWR